MRRALPHRLAGMRSRRALRVSVRAASATAWRGSEVLLRSSGRTRAGDRRVGRRHLGEVRPRRPAAPGARGAAQHDRSADGKTGHRAGGRRHLPRHRPLAGAAPERPARPDGSRRTRLARAARPAGADRYARGLPRLHRAQRARRPGSHHRVGGRPGAHRHCHHRRGRRHRRRTARTAALGRAVASGRGLAPRRGSLSGVAIGRGRAGGLRAGDPVSGRAAGVPRPAGLQRRAVRRKRPPQSC